MLRVIVEFECLWKLLYYVECDQLGHLDLNCSKKKNKEQANQIAQRKQWIPKVVAEVFNVAIPPIVENR